MASGDKDSESYLSSITAVLKALSLLPSEGQSQEQASKSVIEATLVITSKTQTFIKWASAGGAGAGIVGSVLAYLNGRSDVVVAVAIASTALVIAAGLMALARVMDGDVRGRASTATASVEARGAVSEALIRALVGSDAAHGAAPQPEGAAQKIDQPAPSRPPTACLRAWHSATSFTWRPTMARSKLSGCGWSNIGELLRVASPHGTRGSRSGGKPGRSCARLPPGRLRAPAGSRPGCRCACGSESRICS